MSATFSEMTIVQRHLDRLWGFADSASSLLRFTAAAAKSMRLDAAVLRTQAARPLGLQGKFPEARELFEGLSGAKDDDAALAARLSLEA
ncbi:hypothetical protein GCM10027027_20350 [Neomicrococcus lactis]